MHKGSHAHSVRVSHTHTHLLNAHCVL